MSQPFRHNIIGATQLVRAGQIAEATALLQQALGRGSQTIDVPPPAGDAAPPAVTPVMARTPSLFDDMISDMQESFEGFRGFNPFAPAPTPPANRGAAVDVPAHGTFLDTEFANAAGHRPYKLYVPVSYDEAVPMPLVVMLHGCTQSPDDFAAGTRMNLLADRDGVLVCYPGQTKAANGSKCWNWFNDGDQQRDRGEPSLIAGITRDLMATFAVDPRRVYVAGLSAGGALAAIMGHAYPDLYAAVGVHSGLACGAAHSVSSAFTAMRQGGGVPAHSEQATVVPAIVFHGDRDTTVNPVNGNEVAAQTISEAAVTTETEDGRVPGGHGYRRTRFIAADGRTLVEQWNIHGAGHAWSGGSAAGSFTDPQGPDASAAMLRFFAEHARTA